MTFGEGGGHGANLVGIPAGLLGSAVFNDYPRPLRIAGVREQHHDLFDSLAAAPDAALAFDHYMATTFQLAGLGAIPIHQSPSPQPSPRGRGGVGEEWIARRRFRADYRRLLRGWGFDANCREGAVLKSWVESRFGLFPTYHRQPLDRVSSPAWSAYVEEKMSSRFHNNNIFMQLDLLYEFCQWVLARRRTPGRHLILYRGVNDFIEHPLIRKNRDNEIVVRLNNLVSFTADRNIACEFGDTILEVRVPKVKVVFFSELLPRHPLKGEAEYMAIGGDYRVATGYL
jgi:NAD+---dinitrogen-reductase ADP-D-ribosyltransferase